MRAPTGPDIAAGDVLLSVENVSLAFGGVKAVTGVSFVHCSPCCVLLLSG